MRSLRLDLRSPEGTDCTSDYAAVDKALRWSYYTALAAATAAPASLTWQSVTEDITAGEVDPAVVVLRRRAAAYVRSIEPSSQALSCSTLPVKSRVCRSSPTCNRSSRNKLIEYAVKFIVVHFGPDIDRRHLATCLVDRAAMMTA